MKFGDYVFIVIWSIAVTFLVIMIGVLLSGKAACVTPKSVSEAIGVTPGAFQRLPALHLQVFDAGPLQVFRVSKAACVIANQSLILSKIVSRFNSASGVPRFATGETAKENNSLLA